MSESNRALDHDLLASPWFGVRRLHAIEDVDLEILNAHMAQTLYLLNLRAHRDSWERDLRLEPDAFGEPFCVDGLIVRCSGYNIAVARHRKPGDTDRAAGRLNERMASECFADSIWFHADRRWNSYEASRVERAFAGTDYCDWGGVHVRSRDVIRALSTRDKSCSQVWFSYGLGESYTRRWPEDPILITDEREPTEWMAVVRPTWLPDCVTRNAYVDQDEESRS